MRCRLPCITRALSAEPSVDEGGDTGHGPAEATEHQLSLGRGGTSSVFELVVPGEYRWLPITGSQPITLDGQPLAAGETTYLASGEHVADFREDVPGGTLVLALEQPPGLAPLAFYTAN